MIDMAAPLKIVLLYVLIRLFGIKYCLDIVIPAGITIIKNETIVMIFSIPTKVGPKNHGTILPEIAPNPIAIGMVKYNCIDKTFETVLNVFSFSPESTIFEILGNITVSTADMSEIIAEVINTALDRIPTSDLFVDKTPKIVLFKFV